jgi:hypothetical protein
MRLLLTGRGIAAQSIEEFSLITGGPCHSNNAIYVYYIHSNE